MPTIVTAIVLITCILMNMTLTSTIVFTVLATFRIIQDPIRIVPDVLSAIIQAHVAFERLDVFLQEEELSCDAVKRDTCKASEYAVRVENVVLSWNPEELKPFLRNVNLVVKHGEKVAICRGGKLAIVGMVVTQLAFSAAQLYSNMWLATEVSNPSISSSLLIIVYGLVSRLSVVFFFFRSAITINLGLKAS